MGPDGVAVHLAIHSLRSGAPWHEVYDIVKAKVNGLGVEDEESGLMPFMMVAATALEDTGEGESEEEEGRESDVLRLTLVYEMLCMKPDVMNEYISIVGQFSGNHMVACVGDDGAGRMMKRCRL